MWVQYQVNQYLNQNAGLEQVVMFTNRMSVCNRIQVNVYILAQLIAR